MYRTRMSKKFAVIAATGALAATVGAMGVAEIAARPSEEKLACMAAVRERYRAARAECMKKPFGPERNRCRDRADKEEAAGRDACRKQKPPASPFQ